MARISEALGLKEDAEHHASEAARLKTEFQNEYITPNGRLAPDTMTSLALALVFGLFETQEHRDRAAGRLDYLVRSSNFKIATGFVGTPIILPALTQIAKTQLAYRMLLEKKCPSWLYPITMGATTVSPSRTLAKIKKADEMNRCGNVGTPCSPTAPSTPAK